MYRLPDTPEVFSPDYWGGADLADPESLATLSTVQLGEVGSFTAVRPTASIERVLTSVRENRNSERTNTLGNTFDPTEAQLPDGTVLILDSEGLALHVDGQGEAAACPGTDDGSDSTPPITKPYLGYWADNIGVPGIGREFLASSDGTLEYMRYLSWAVLVTKKNRRIALGYGFDAPISSRYIVKVPDLQRRGRVLPVPIGETQRAEEQPCGADSSLRVSKLWRVKDVNIVPPAGTGERKKDRKPVYERVREWVQSQSGVVLPQPNLRPVRVYSSDSSQ